MQLPHPWLSAAQINIGSMLVAVAIDVRMRRLYAKRMQLLATQASSDGSCCCCRVNAVNNNDTSKLNFKAQVEKCK